MLADGILNNLTLIRNGIELDLLGFLHKLAHYHGVILRHLGGHLQKALQLFVVVTYIHRCTREYVRRTHENGEANLIDKLLDVVKRRQRAPCRLVDTQFIEHRREFITVLSAVDINRRGAQDRYTLFI